MALEYPNNLQYLNSHEYVQLEEGIATIGISAFAVNQLGDIVFLELPEVGDIVTKGESFGSVESVKAVQDLYSAVSGTVVERNEVMITAPEKIARNPYTEGWLLKVRVSSPNEADNTMSADEYRVKVEGN